MAGDRCLVCDRPEALPVIEICGSCLQFAKETFSTLTEAVSSGSRDAATIDWVALVESATRIATGSDELRDAGDRIAEIVGNATTIIGSLDAINDEIRVALDGGKPDVDRVADAINDGVEVVFGRDATSLLVQAGIRVGLGVLAGDSVKSMLRGVLEEILPGWMMSDLWLDAVLADENPAPAKPKIGPHEYSPGRHDWKPIDGTTRFTCSSCGLDPGVDFASRAMERCPDKPDACMYCDEPADKHPGYLPQDLLRELDGLRREFLTDFRSAQGQPRQSAPDEMQHAIDTYFDSVDERLSATREEWATSWMTRHGSPSFSETLADITPNTANAQPAMHRMEANEEAYSRAYRLIDYERLPAGLEFPWGVPTPGDPELIDLIVDQLPDHPAAIEFGRAMGESTGESADAADQERAAYSFGVRAGQIQQSYPPG